MESGETKMAKEQEAREAVKETNASPATAYVQPQRRPRNFRQFIDRMIDEVPVPK
jgi:hypothetical protein